MTDCPEIEDLTLEQRNQWQATEIEKLWVQLTAIRKRDSHAQKHIARLEARVVDLQSQLTDEAKASWVFRN